MKIFLLLALLATATAQHNTATQQAQAAPSHNIWDALLRKYVNSKGQINYKGLKKEQQKLQSYLSLLQNAPPQGNWSRAEKMTYWINAYNAFTVKLILDNYPLTSIMKLDNGKTWDVKRIRIGNVNYSLNDIEHEQIRKQFKDARIHFAVNCAAKSCPPLLNRAWTATNLEADLENQTRAFVNDPRANQISAKQASLSKIFEWYATDFGNLTDFLNRYSKVKISGKTSIRYMEYDWSLNE
ncbi:MAG: hypothetical protein RI973_1659 [Bacteroidota bacterium]|jgi:hypothetical protein